MGRKAMLPRVAAARSRQRVAAKSRRRAALTKTKTPSIAGLREREPRFSAAWRLRASFCRPELRSPLALEYGASSVSIRKFTAALVAVVAFGVASAATRTSGGPAAVDTARIVQ